MRIRTRAILLGLLCAVGMAVCSGGMASADSCPNAAFRTGPSAALPDCRAYEMVSPPYKGSGPAETVGPFISESGSEMHMNDIGGFGDPGDDAGFWGSEYLTARTGSGWASTPIDPPLSQFDLPQGEERDISQDFRRTLFFAAPIALRPGRHGERAYIREPNGSFVEVGPLLPPSALSSQAYVARYYEGASADLSHIVFILEGGNSEILWPGDETTAYAPSLYEYVGTGNAVPALVGVNNSGEQISRCGTTLGANETEASLGAHANAKFNAISRSGGSVFFSVDPCEGGPPVGEVYARIGESRTVAISEPSVEDCSACDTTLVDRSGALFQGASEDGSKVFFLTSQPLLGGDSTVNLYEYDFDAPAGQRVVRVSAGNPAGANVQGVVRISEDGSRVYFVAQGVLTGEPNGLGQSAVDGEDNLYLYEPDPTSPGQFKTVFVTTLSSGDSQDWGYNDSRPDEVTPDGRFLLLPSVNRLTPDCAACTGVQLYRYDAQTGALVRISIGENGFDHNGTLAIYSSIIAPGYGESRAMWIPGSMSNDGSYVFFTSSAGLTANALNEACIGEITGECYGYARNVYEYHEGQVYLISDGQDLHRIGGSTTLLVGASASGSDVFFQTADPLVPQDTDTQVDIYDARIDGGFPPETVASCQGDGCQGAQSSPPTSMVPGSATFSGPGNPVSVSQPARTVKKKKKAMKKKKKAKKQARRKSGRHKARRDDTSGKGR